MYHALFFYLFAIFNILYRKYKVFLYFFVFDISRSSLNRHASAVVSRDGRQMRHVVSGKGQIHRPPICLRTHLRVIRKDVTAFRRARLSLVVTRYRHSPFLTKVVAFPRR